MQRSLAAGIPFFRCILVVLVNGVIIQEPRVYLKPCHTIILGISKLILISVTPKGSDMETTRAYDEEYHKRNLAFGRDLHQLTWIYGSEPPQRGKAVARLATTLFCRMEQELSSSLWRPSVSRPLALPPLTAHQVSSPAMTRTSDISGRKNPVEKR